MFLLFFLSFPITTIINAGAGVGGVAGAGVGGVAAATTTNNNNK